MIRMTPRRATATAIASITAGAMLAAAVPAVASTPDNHGALAQRTASAVEQATGTDGLNPGLVRETAFGTQVTSPAPGGDTSVLIPPKSDAPLVVTSEGTSVSIGLPQSETTSAVNTGSTVVHPNAGGSVDTAVQATDEGARALITIKDASAPSEYRFPVDLPEGATLQQTGDGSILAVGADGELIGLFDTP